MNNIRKRGPRMNKYNTKKTRRMDINPLEPATFQIKRLQITKIFYFKL